MSLVIFQITIKQWDKGQNTPAHQHARSAMPTSFPITAEPAFNIFNTECIFEQHGDDVATNVFSNGRIKKSVLSIDRVILDRFQIVNSPSGFVLEYFINGEPPKILGQLNEDWIQARYTWRYSVLESNQIYWMYEEVTLNAMCVEELDADYFIKTLPSLVFDNL
jgi:hypothetical protein